VARLSAVEAGSCSRCVRRALVVAVGASAGEVARLPAVEAGGICARRPARHLSFLAVAALVPCTVVVRHAFLLDGRVAIGLLAVPPGGALVAVAPLVVVAARVAFMAVASPSVIVTVAELVAVVPPLLVAVVVVVAFSAEVASLFWDTAISRAVASLPAVAASVLGVVGRWPASWAGGHVVPVGGARAVGVSRWGRVRGGVGLVHWSCGVRCPFRAPSICVCAPCLPVHRRPSGSLCALHATPVRACLVVGAALAARREVARCAAVELYLIQPAVVLRYAC